MTQSKQLKVKLIRSINNVLPNHKLCIKGLGLRRLQQTVVVENTPCNRGMINKAYYLVSVEEI